MILVNILALVALAAAIVAMMLSDQETGADRSLSFREASQAAVLARAGEMSAIVALRRDAVEAPQTDHLREPWAAVIDREAAIQGGTFTLAVSDAQSRFNLNNLGQGGAFSALAIAPMAAALQLDPALLARIGAAIQENGALLRLSQLRDLGVDDATIKRLAPLVTTLPGATTVNVNTASEELLALLTGSAASAQMLVAQRKRAGFLTPEDLGALNLSMPQGAGFTSNHYWVRTTVTIGDTSQTLTSLVARVVKDGRPDVITLGRWRGPTAPDQVSALE
jgi:general secretion pathway protein K